MESNKSGAARGIAMMLLAAAGANGAFAQRIPASAADSGRRAIVTINQQAIKDGIAGAAGQAGRAAADAALSVTPIYLENWNGYNWFQGACLKSAPRVYTDDPCAPGASITSMMGQGASYIVPPGVYYIGTPDEMLRNCYKYGRDDCGAPLRAQISASNVVYYYYDQWETRYGQRLISMPFSKTPVNVMVNYLFQTLSFSTVTTGIPAYGSLAYVPARLSVPPSPPPTVDQQAGQ